MSPLWSVNISKICTPHSPLVILILWSIKSNCLHFSRNWKIYLFFRIYLHPRSLQVKPAITKSDVKLIIWAKCWSTWALPHQWDTNLTEVEVEVAKIKWKLLLMTFAQTFQNLRTFSQNETEWRADIQQIPFWIKD